MAYIDNEIIKYIVACAVKDKKILTLLCPRVTEDCFYSDGEALYFAAWQIISEYYRKFNELVTIDALRALLAQLVSESAIDVTMNEIEEYCTYIKNVEVDEKAVKELANKWLLNRSVAEPVISKLSSETDGVIEILEEGSSKARKIFVADPKIRRLLTDSQLTANIQNVEPTGVSFFDERVGGGLAPKEVAILLGPTKAGKTTLAIQLACSAASLSRMNNDKRKIAFIVYEDNFDAVTARIICHMAKIPRDRLMQCGLEGLSKEAGSQLYEHEIISNTGKSLRSEYERVKNLSWLDEYLVVIDHSGRSGDFEIGCLGVDEIVDALRAHDPDNHGYRLVIIDWLGLLLTRYLEFRGVRETTKELAFRLRSLPDELFRKIANPFNVPVLGVHQLSGMANKKGPTDQVDHTDAEWCKSLGVMAWHVFVLRQPDRRNNVSVFNATISRRCPIGDPALIKLDGRFGTFYDVSHEYWIDSVTRRILTKTERNEEFKQIMRKHSGRFDI